MARGGGEKSVEDRLKEMSAPAFVEATFSGTYYKSSGAGRDTAPFEKTVKIPERWLQRDDVMPETLFVRHYAKAELSKEPGYQSVRSCVLVNVDRIPRNLEPERQLAWSATKEQLTEFAETFARKVEPSLYMSALDLKKAIKRALSAPEVFEQEQQKFAGGDVKENQRMMDELKALGYE